MNQTAKEAHFESGLREVMRLCMTCSREGGQRWTAEDSWNRIAKICETTEGILRPGPYLDDQLRREWFKKGLEAAANRLENIAKTVDNVADNETQKLMSCAYRAAAKTFREDANDRAKLLEMMAQKPEES